VIAVLVACLTGAVLALMAAAWCCWRHHPDVTHRPKRDPHDLPLISNGQPPSLRQQWLTGHDEPRGDRPGVDTEKEQEK
jgi:hypothetical protein